MKLIYKEFSRNYGKSESIRIAEKLLGLSVQDLIIKLAEAVNKKSPPRVIDVIRTAAVARFEESIEYAMKGNVKL